MSLETANGYRPDYVVGDDMLTLDEAALLLEEDYLNGRFGVSGQQLTLMLMHVMGALSLPQLQKALNALPERLPRLKTGFVRSPDVTDEVIHRAVQQWSVHRIPTRNVYRRASLERSEPVEVHALPICSTYSGDSVLSLATEHAAVRPFRRASAPQLRAVIGSRSPDDHFIVVIAPALVCPSSIGTAVMDEMCQALAGEDAYVRECRPEQLIAMRCEDEHDTESSLSSLRQLWAEYGPTQLSVADLPLALPPLVPNERTLRTRYHTLELIPREWLASREPERLGDAYTLALAAFAVAVKACTYKCKFPIWIDYRRHGAVCTRNDVHVQQNIVGCDLAGAAESEAAVRIDEALATVANHAHVSRFELWWTCGHAGEHGIPLSYDLQPDRIGGRDIVSAEHALHIVESRVVQTSMNGCHMAANLGSAGLRVTACYAPYVFDTRAVEQLLYECRQAFQSLAKTSMTYFLAKEEAQFTQDTVMSVIDEGRTQWG